jgi:hypothetical protein
MDAEEAKLWAINLPKNLNNTSNLEDRGLIVDKSGLIAADDDSRSCVEAPGIVDGRAAIGMGASPLAEKSPLARLGLAQ